MAFGRPRIRRIHAITVLVLSYSISAYSTELGTERLRFNGFGTLAATDSGNDELYSPYYLSKDNVNDDGISWDESLLGLQLDASISDSLEASIQIVFRNRYDDSLEEDIERAFIKYSKGGLLLRAGRLGIDVYMLSEYRNIGFAYLWAHPPMEFYGPFSMDYYNGAEVEYSFQLPKGAFQARVYGGESTQAVKLDQTLTEMDYRPLFGTTLIYSQDAWLLRLSTAKNTIDSDIEPLRLLREYLNTSTAYWPQAESIADDLEIEDSHISFTSLGVMYDAYPWIAQSEVSYTDIESDVFATFYSGYLSLGYTIDDITLFTFAGVIKPEEDRRVLSGAPDGFESLQEAAQRVFDTNLDQKSLSLGLRWNLMNNLALKAQWDRTWVEAYGGGLWSSDEINTNSETIDTFSLNFSFIF